MQHLIVCCESLQEGWVEARANSMLSCPVNSLLGAIRSQAPSLSKSHVVNWFVDAGLHGTTSHQGVCDVNCNMSIKKRGKIVIMSDVSCIGTGNECMNHHVVWFGAVPADVSTKACLGMLKAVKKFVSRVPIQVFGSQDKDGALHCSPFVF